MSSFERICYIHKKIQNSKAVSYQDVKSNFKISLRQFRRDLAKLRSCGAPIHFLKEKNAYGYTYPFDDFDFIEEKNLLFFTFLEGVSKNRSYLPFVVENVLNSLRDKLLPNRYKKLLSHISYECEEYIPFKMNEFKIFIEGMMERKQIKIKYRNSKGIVSKRTVEPLYLMCYASQWYFIAYDCQKKDIRTFHSGRIEEAILTEEYFKSYIRDDKLKKYIEDTFGIYKSDKVKKVKARFYEPAYYNVLGQVWHKDEKKIEGTHPEYGKYIEIEIPVGDYGEVIGKVLRFTPYSEILEPENLRQEWLNRLRESTEKFS